MTPITLKVNGEAAQGLAEPRTALADFLRDTLRLTGTHLGCEHGVCGACTVLIDGKPARSCIAYAAQCEGSEVRTIEGFEEDALMKDLRAAFSREHALQCGFCTPGMLISARDLIQRVPQLDERRIREEMSGNLCRCTGYVGIVRAIASVSRSRGAANEAPVAEVAKVAPVAFTPILSKEIPEEKSRTAVTGGTRIEDSFTVAHPVEKVWTAFADMPAVAACLPGAEISEASGNSVKGRVSVKFGPMSAAFAGAATVERDEAAKRGTIRGGGHDNLSGSRVKADISYALQEAAAGSTRILVTIDYSLQGALAQFSRGGLVREFVGQMTADFARNLERRLGGGEVAPAKEMSAASFLWRWLKALFK
jgi:carbon-monoxide dehydrogenase small subunit